MKNANEVILTGCSAGGLGTYIHADYVASVVPQSAKFLAMADAGYVISTFLNSGSRNKKKEIIMLCQVYLFFLVLYTQLLSWWTKH